MADLSRAARAVILLAGDVERMEQVVSLWHQEAVEIVASSQLVPAVLEEPRDVQDAKQLADWAEGVVRRIQTQRSAWARPVRSMLAAVNVQAQQSAAPLEEVAQDLRRRLAAADMKRPGAASTPGRR